MVDYLKLYDILFWSLWFIDDIWFSKWWMCNAFNLWPFLAWCHHSQWFVWRDGYSLGDFAHICWQRWFPIDSNRQPILKLMYPCIVVCYNKIFSSINCFGTQVCIPVYDPSSSMLGQGLPRVVCIWIIIGLEGHCEQRWLSSTDLKVIG